MAKTDEIKADKGDSDIQSRRRSRTSLVMLAAIAVVPLLTACVIFFFFPSLTPEGTTNEGNLIDPPISMAARDGEPELTVPGKWTLVVVAGHDCGDACERALYLSRQVNIALGKDAERVQRTLILADEEMSAALDDLLETGYPQLAVRVPGSETALDVFRRVAGTSDLAGYVFVADPNGNLMLYYTPSNDGEQMLKDLKHLLRLSNIG